MNPIKTNSAPGLLLMRCFALWVGVYSIRKNFFCSSQSAGSPVLSDLRVKLEIAYHREPNIDPSGKKILHIHEYRVKGDMSNRPGRLLTSDEYEKYKKYVASYFCVLDTPEACKTQSAS